MTTLASIIPLTWLSLLHATWLAVGTSGLVALRLRLRPTLSHTTRHTVLLSSLVLIPTIALVLSGWQQSTTRRPEARNVGGRLTVVPFNMKLEHRLDGVPRNFHSAFYTSQLMNFAIPLRARAAELLRQARPFGLLAWALGAGGLTVRLAVGAIGVRRLRRLSFPADATVQARAQCLGTCLGLARVPEIRVHPRLVEPCLAGLIRPVVILPSAWLATASQAAIEAVLAHELAHASRRDPVIQWIQRWVEAGLFFHPCLHWLSRSLRIEREHCADALAARVTGAPLELAKALESVARFRLSTGTVPGFPVLARPGLALGGEGMTLFSRVEELIGMTPKRPRPTAWPLLAIPAAATLALLAGAVEPDEKPPAAQQRYADFFLAAFFDPAGRAAVAFPDDKPAKPAQPISPAKPVPVEERQVSYEIRIACFEADAISEASRKAITPVEVEGQPAGFILGPDPMRKLVDDLQRLPTTNLIQAPRITAYEGAQAMIRLGGDEPATQPPGRLEVVASGHCRQGMTRLTLDARAPLDHPPGQPDAHVRSTLVVPEGTSGGVSLGTVNQKREGRDVKIETIVIVTPRHIVLEAEEEAIPRRRLPARQVIAPRRD